MPKAAKTKPTPAAKRFEARLERMRSRLNRTIIHLPFDAGKVWGMRGPIKVKGEINGFAFRSALFPSGEGGHILPVNQRMQKGASVTEGSVARFVLEVDGEERIVSVPDGLKRMLGQDRALRRWYGELNRSTRNQIAQWISEPKSTAARLRRAEQIAERLLAVMEAERELPPILQVAFARHPRAREGWDGMSAARRRAHLMTIYYYRNPEGRERCIGKMLDDASARAGKMSGKKK